MTCERACCAIGTCWALLACARVNTRTEDEQMFLSMHPATLNTCDITTGYNRTPMVVVKYPPEDRMLPLLQVRSADDPQLIVFDGPRECQICGLNGLGNTYRTARARKFGTYCPLLMPLRYECLYCGSYTWLRLESYVDAENKASIAWLVNTHLFARFYDKNGDQRHVQLAQTYTRFNFAAMPPEFEGCRVGIRVAPFRKVVRLDFNACVLDSVDTLIYQLAAKARMSADVLSKATVSMCVFYVATEPIHLGETTRISHRQGRLDVPFVAHDTPDRLDLTVRTTVGHLAAIKYTRELLVLGAIASLCGAAHVPLVLTLEVRDRLYEVIDALIRTPSCAFAGCKALPSHGIRANLRGEDCAFSKTCAQHCDTGRHTRVLKVARRDADSAPTPARFEAFRALVATMTPSGDDVPDVHALYDAYVKVLCSKQRGGASVSTTIPNISERNKCVSTFIDMGRQHCIRAPTAAERAVRDARERLLASGDGCIRHFPGDVIDVGQKSELVFVPDPTNIMSYVSVTSEFATPVRVDKSAFYNAHNARLEAGTLDAHAHVYATEREYAFTTRLMFQAPFMWDVKASRGKLDNSTWREEEDVL